MSTIEGIRLPGISVLRTRNAMNRKSDSEIRTSQVDAEELRRKIEHTLDRRADREAEWLRIEVNDGAVLCRAIL